MDVDASDTLDDGGTVHYLRRAALPGVEAMKVTSSTKLWRVFHETYTVASIATSRGDWRYRGRSLELVAGEVSLMEPGEVHTTTRLSGPCDFRVLHIARDVVAPIAEELTGTPSVQWRSPQAGNPRVYASLQHLHAELESSTSRLALDSAFLGAVRCLVRECAETRVPVARTHARAKMQRVREEIDARLDENVSLQELAAHAGLTRFETLRAFKLEYGLPPHAYQLHMRLCSARTLLQNGLAPSEVAALVGFADQSHLARHFKRAFGVTPGKYRGR